MRKALFLLTTLFLLQISTTLSAQEGYTDDSPTTPTSSGEIGSVTSDETPNFPSISELIANQVYVKPAFEVIGVETSLGHKTRPAFQVVIPNVEIDDAGKAWEKFMKNYGGNVDEKEAVIEATGVKIKGVSNRSMNVYAKLQQKVEGSGLIAIFETGKNDYIGEDSEMNEGVEALLSEFATNFAKEDAEDRLKNVEKALKDLENLLNKLKRQNEGYHKDIVKAKGDIAEAKGTIDMTKQQQELTETIIETHEENETYIEDDEASKEASKELKKKNKELKKLERTKDRSIKNIDKNEQDIIESEENIEENERQQKMVVEAILNQKQEVKNAERYLKLFE